MGGALTMQAQTGNPWDQRYAADEYVYGTEPNVFLREVLPQLPKGRALSLAEGEGRNAVFLAEYGFTVIAVDGSAVGLAKARQLAAARQVSLETQVADLADYVIAPGHYQVVTSIFAHLPPPLRDKVLRRACEGLSVGGMLVLVQYHPDQLHLGTGGPKEPERLCDMQTLQAACHNIRWRVAEQLEIDLHEGDKHRGISSVIHLLGEKY